MPAVYCITWNCRGITERFHVGIALNCFTSQNLGRIKSYYALLNMDIVNQIKLIYNKVYFM